MELPKKIVFNLSYCEIFRTATLGYEFVKRYVNIFLLLKFEYTRTRHKAITNTSITHTRIYNLLRGNVFHFFKLVKSLSKVSVVESYHKRD